MPGPSRRVRTSRSAAAVLLLAGWLGLIAGLPSRAEEDQTYSLDNILANPRSFRTGSVAIHATLRSSADGITIRQDGCGWDCPAPVRLTLPANIARTRGFRAFSNCLEQAAGLGDDLEGYIKVRVLAPAAGEPLQTLALAGAIEVRIVTRTDRRTVSDCAV